MHRRTLLAAAMSAPALPAAAATTRAEGQVRATLLAFLKAFENCDLPTMEAAFAPDATAFDPVVMSATARPDSLTPFRRANGMPPRMRQVAIDLPKQRPGPPYQQLPPGDLAIQLQGDVAVCTFHLGGETSLGRRTIVLARRGNAWKIIHIHASSVAVASA